MVLSVENPPWNVLYRAVIGYFLMPVWARWPGEPGGTWKLVGLFLLVLAALRVVPGIVRRVLPFSTEVKMVWAERRALAKRYDSYQWRKLFGFGLGWMTYLIVSRQAQSTPVVFALGCLIAGAIGSAFWYTRRKVLSGQTKAGAVASA
jgi:hypothetical protein